MNAIHNISSPLSLSLPPLEAPAAETQGSSFKDFLWKSIDEVNAMQQAADQAVEQMSTGGEVNPAEVLTAVQKADLAFRTMLQVRNKLVEAYQEIQAIRV
jgi:flagellar hook-basal body complex protein FliE